MTIVKLILLAALTVGVAAANQSASGWCTPGATTVITASIPSTNQVMGAYPQCTVTVYVSGTTTVASIFSNSASVPLANPFTATMTGFWQFYATNGTYDVTISGAGLPSAFTFSGLNFVGYDSIPVDFPYLDIRASQFGAIGYQGNCTALTADDKPQIQAALNFAYSVGPPAVYIPSGYCWPIGSHLRVPTGVRMFGNGRTNGSGVSSAGSLIIANTSWGNNNQTFPFTQMVWETGDDYAAPPFLANNITYAAEVDHLTIDCNNQLGCGNALGVGRQEKSTFHDDVFVGGVGPTAGYGYGLYLQSVDCNGAAPAARGCLLSAASAPQAANPWNGEDGPDYQLEIFTSYTTPTNNWIPYANMGAADYKGLQNSTLNCNGTSTPPNAAYFWGSGGQNFGQGLHIEGCTNNNVYVGGVPGTLAGTNTGSDHIVFYGGLGTHYVLSPAQANTDLTFLGIQAGITNNTPNAVQVNVPGPDYYFNSATGAAGPLGIDNDYRTPANIFISDPGTINQIGYAGFHAYLGQPGSGWNAGNAGEVATPFMRAYSGGNVFWNHATGLWTLGGDGGSDYSAVLHLNSGALGLSAVSSSLNTFSGAQMMLNTKFVVSGAGHTLIGAGFLDQVSGSPTGEDYEALQVVGSAKIDQLVVTGNANIGPLVGLTQAGSTIATTCPTAATVGATCTFTVAWPTAFANNSYHVGGCSLWLPTGSPVQTGIGYSNNGAIIVTITALTAVAAGGSTMTCMATP